MSAWLIFSDLDESLIGRDGSSFEPARPALAEVRRRGIPLIFCTSKTAAEARHLQDQMRIEAPFVVESGGGVYFPRGAFRDLPEPREERGNHVLVPLAVKRDRVLQGLALLRESRGGGIRAFSELSPGEVARETGLSLEMARRACLREFDEPFRILGGEQPPADELSRVVRPLGLRVSRGGRFYHVHGDTDKGRAVQLLVGLYRKSLGAVRTLAVGDSAIDAPMLAVADVAIAVLRGDGTHDPELTSRVPGLRRVPFAGPEGWNAGVLAALQADSPSENSAQPGRGVSP